VTGHLTALVFLEWMQEIRTLHLIVSTNMGWTYLTAMDAVGQGVDLLNGERSSVLSAHHLVASFPLLRINFYNSLIIEQTHSTLSCIEV
jgi:hypothetical protein